MSNLTDAGKATIALGVYLAGIISAGATLALYTTATGDDGSGTEVDGTGNGYERQTLAMEYTTDGILQNTDPIVYVDMPAVTVTHVALIAPILDPDNPEDPPVAGMMAHVALDTPVTLGAGDSFTMAAGAFQIAVT